jgi:hypothetical protein
MKTRFGIILIVACGAILLSASPDTEAQRPIELPPGQTDYFYRCGGWEPEEPRAAVGLFDIFYGRRTAEDPDDGPYDWHREDVRSVGGRIVHEFNLPVLRARLRVSEIPKLRAGFLISVDRPRDHTIDGLIGIPLPLSESHQSALDELGVTILGEITTINVLHAFFPDESIPAIRALDGVRYVEYNGYDICPPSPGAGVVLPGQQPGSSSQQPEPSTWGRIKVRSR